MRVAFALISLSLGFVSSASADCAVQSGAARAHLIELYTSEGCSSCPPADQWLRQLPQSASVVALAFHVDYWDSLGWRDRFADARYTTRQQALAARAESGIVYTPEVVLDGREWRDWHGDGALSSLPSSAATMKLTVAAGTRLHVHVDTALASPTEAASYRNYVALTEDGLTSHVQAGENRGVLLRHDHVVRAFVGPLPLAGGEVDVPVPAGVDLAHATLVAFAQRARDGDVAQVVSLPLEQCHN